MFQVRAEAVFRFLPGISPKRPARG